MRKEDHWVWKVLLCIALTLIFIHLLSRSVGGSPIDTKGIVTVLEKETYCTIRDTPYVFTAPYGSGWRMAWEVPIGKCTDGRNLFLGIDLLYEENPREFLLSPNILS